MIIVLLFEGLVSLDANSAGTTVSHPVIGVQSLGFNFYLISIFKGLKLNIRRGSLFLSFKAKLDRGPDMSRIYIATTASTALKISRTTITTTRKVIFRSSSIERAKEKHRRVTPYFCGATAPVY